MNLKLNTSRSGASVAFAHTVPAQQPLEATTPPDLLHSAGALCQ